MDGHHVTRWLLQGAGAALVLLILVDVFLTVLYARVGTSILSDRLAKLLWRLFRLVGERSRIHRGTVLSFCGPIVLLCLLAVWAFGLAFGTALILKPALGTAIRASDGDTPDDFVTALYAGAGSMSIVGAGDYSPHTGPFKLLFMFNSLVGVCMISLTLTYLMQVYNALQRRNVVALRAHIATGETGDAAELVAGLGPEGDFTNALTRLSEMASQMTEVKEVHHFYSLLMYFRFRESYYAVTHLQVVMLDTVTLIKSALDDDAYAALKESSAVADLWGASMRLLTGIAPTLLPEGAVEAGRRESDDAATHDRWRRRYSAALRRFREAGIRTTADERAGAEVYVSLRARWDRYIVAYADHMAFERENIDPAGTNPAGAAQRPEFRARLRSAG